MRVCHNLSASFDDPNLVSCAGLVPVMALAGRAGLHDLAAAHVRVPGSAGANPGVKVTMTGAYGSDINLPGWADQSIWGYDPLLECYWAQLWRDEDRTDRPRVWISTHHLIPTMALLTRLLADALDLPEVQVVRALTT